MLGCPNLMGVRLNFESCLSLHTHTYTRMYVCGKKKSNLDFRKPEAIFAIEIPKSLCSYCFDFQKTKHSKLIEILR